MPVETAFRTALAHHQAGRLAEAVAGYQDVLTRAPDHLFAAHYLGVAFHQSGAPREALPLLIDTVARQPQNAGFLVNLANARKDLELLDEAEQGYRAALAIDPQFAPAAFSLGQLCELRGDLVGAEDAYARVPALPEARQRLAVLRAVTDPEGALEIAPGPPPGTPGERRQAQARLLHQAIILMAHCRRGTDIERLTERLDQLGGPAALIDAGQNLLQLEQLDAARQVFVRALQTAPRDPHALTLYGVALNRAGMPGAAAAALGAALTEGVDDPLLWAAYADSLRGVGDHAGAEQAVREVLAKQPSDTATLSSLQQLNLCRADRSAADLLALANAYGETVRLHLPMRPAGLPDAPVRSRTARLRVGILSPDLGDHPVGKFIVNFFRHHPRDQIELWAFADGGLGNDRISADIRGNAARVVDCRSWSNAQLAEAIAAARLDILLDLAGHTPGNRLPMLAWRLAPAQGTFLGYAGTTGAPGIDFRIADALTEPAGAEAYSTERIIRLPGSYFCYDPGVAEMPVRQPADNRPPVFGCFVQRIKITGQTLDLWLTVLAAVPGARMQVRCRSFADPVVRADFAETIAARGGDPGRFDLQPWAQGTAYFQCYDGVDIGLNTFPFHQATTLCDALWMGVPTLSLSGAEHRSRMADSILSAAGHPEWCFASSADLAAAAARLCYDRPALTRLQQSLAAHIPVSALADGPGYAQRLATALTGVL